MSSTLRPQATGRPMISALHADQQLRHRLNALRRRLRVVAASRGVGWLLACLFATVVLAGLLDFRVHLPGLVRAFVLVGLLAGLGVLLVRHLLRPLAVPADDLSLALRIEERYPLLNDGLASTVEFLERTPPTGESASMRGEAIRRALHKIHGLDFNRVVDARGLRSACLLAVVATGVAIGLAVVWPRLAATAVARLANPFADIEWPRKTQIELDRPVERIGRGREYRLKGTLRGVIPAEVVVEITSDSFPKQYKNFAVHPDDHTFALHLKPEEVQKSFRYRIFANDAVSPPVAVEVLPLPVLANLDGKPSPQVRLEPPAYTDLPSPQLLQPGVGNLEIVAGTEVTLRAAVDRPLRKAWIEYQPELQGTTQAACLAPLASASPLGVVSGLVLSKGLYERIPAKVGLDRRQLEVTFRPATNGAYGLYFEDEYDLVNSRVYELRLRIDPPPVVKFERPSPSKDLLQVLPTAVLPFHVIVEDPQFAVRSAWMTYRFQDEALRGVPLYHHLIGPGRELGPWGGVASVAVVPRLRLTQLEFDRKLPVRSFKHQDGSPAREGDVITVQVFADDFDDVSVGKEPGRSHEVVIRVVGKDTLEVELNREQARVQKELETLRDKQREALSKVKEVEQRVRKGGKMVPEREVAEAEAQAQKEREEAAAAEEKADKAATQEERQRRQQEARTHKQAADKQEQRAQELKKQAQQLNEAEQLQQQIREKVGNEAQGLRSDLDKLKETMRQNNLENSNAMERMKRVSQELDRLAEKELEKIEPDLSNARKLAELEDQKVREERRAELEKKAKATEQEAKAAEERAQKLKEKAAELEKAAQVAEGDDRARKEEQASQAKKQADDERQKAAEKRAQAERDRKEAQEGPDPERARRTLADARRGQEEVERSLSQLLQELEPWSSTLEINNEAGRILQEQKDLQEQLAELEKELRGKNKEDLTEAEKTDLKNAQEAQQRLQERAANLMNQMKRMAEARAEKDPETAADLKKAAEQAEENNLQGQMNQAQENIGQNKLNEARKKQREAIAEMEKLLKNLKDSRETRLDRLGRKLKEAEERVEKLMDEQEKLQRKIREAADIKDPKKREEELQRLAKRQKELQQQAEEVRKQLSRMGNDRAGQMMKEAAEEMGEALKKLERGQKDEEKQEDVLDRLEETRRELERARKKAEEELGREQLVKVADVIRRIRERQEGHLVEAKRIQDAVLQRKGWSRGLKQSLSGLGENQRGLAQEATAVAKKDLSSAPIFSRMVERAASAMEKASSRAAALVRESPPLEQVPDAELVQEQAVALRRLDQLLASLKEAMDEPRPLSRGDGGGEGGEDEGGGGGGPQGDDSLPPLAQLKLLRMMQKEVNDRTEAFAKKNPNPDALGPKEKAELQEIRREQKDIGDLVERYTRPPGEDPEPDVIADKAEKKQEEKKP